MKEECSNKDNVTAIMTVKNINLVFHDILNKYHKGTASVLETNHHFYSAPPFPLSMRLARPIHQRHYTGCVRADVTACHATMPVPVT